MSFKIGDTVIHSVSGEIWKIINFTGEEYYLETHSGSHTCIHRDRMFQFRKI